MKTNQVKQFAESLSGDPVLIETHISWVVLAGRLAYKIKKPLHFSFLDFSTLEKRKYYCEQEVTLNKRLAASLYVSMLPVYQRDDIFSLEPGNGEAVEYAVLMNRMDTAKEMDRMLENGTVSEDLVGKLAHTIAVFHGRAQVIDKPFALEEARQKFNDLQTLTEQVEQYLGQGFSVIIQKAVKKSDAFLNQNEAYLCERALQGYTRDVHGDLHCGNIFLTENPVVFDCIEFNDSLRQIDILDEAAFLCMDLESYGREGLSALFYREYLQLSKMKETAESRQLFQYYQCYRSNVRAKIHLLDAIEAPGQKTHSKKLQNAKRYLLLLERYLTAL